jgi:hypothetical protein
MVYIPSEVADRMYESLQHIQILAKEIEGEVGESGIEDQAQTARDAEGVANQESEEQLGVTGGV